MTELIIRQEAINVVAKTYRCESDRTTALQELPITTEAEIREKAIDDVFEFLKGRRDKKNMKVGLDDLEIRKYKERLMEEGA